MIAIVDYGAGNLCSIPCAATAAGAQPTVTDDLDAVRFARRIVLPRATPNRPTSTLCIAAWSILPTWARFLPRPTMASGFLSVVARENVWAFQRFPEKSDDGLTPIDAWVNWIP